MKGEGDKKKERRMQQVEQVERTGLETTSFRERGRLACSELQSSLECSRLLYSTRASWNVNLDILFGRDGLVEEVTGA